MAGKVQEKEITPEQKDNILNVLKNRFEKNSSRHKEISWAEVEKKLEANHDKLWKLS